jgi:hypothetical protein
MRNHSPEPDVESLAAIGWSFASITAVVALIAAFLVLGEFNPGTAVQQTSLDTSITAR